MNRYLNYVSALCVGLAVGGCAPSESQRAKEQVDESAKSQKQVVDQNAAATKKAIDENAAGTKKAINQDVDTRRGDAQTEATNDRQKAANLDDASKKASADAAAADKRAADAK